MTEKEKAKELVEKYSIWAWNETVCDYSVAIECAKIAVDEILSITGGYINQYYQEVKKELEAMK